VDTETLDPGQVVLRLGWMGTYVHTQHDDMDDVVGRGTIPIIHDQHIALSEARLSLDAGLTTRFGASLMVPFRVIDTTIDYRDGMGDIVQLVTPNIHHRDETLTGLGDPMLLGSFATKYVTVRAGLSVPLGKTEDDPFQLGDMGLPHEHIQMGTGTVNPVLAAEGGYSFAPWRVGGYAFTQQIVYENSKGYQAGDRYAGGVFARRSFGAWGARAGVDVQGETSERWHGVRHTEEGNQGRIDAMVSLGGSWGATARLAFDLSVKIPFITHVVGGQLDMPAILEVGAAWRFGAAPKAGHHHHDGDDDDDHDHHHDSTPAVHVDTTGADVVDLQPPGAAVDLVPVRGKLTIFDFGASWCEPCKTLEPVLVKLAKKYPDRVALRRIDVVDWDSAVVARYLTPRAFDLPHVKVYDERGTLVFERSSAPGKLEAMIHDIRTLVEPSAPTPSAATPDAHRVEIVVTEKGFEPAEVKVPRDRPVTLVFTRTTDKTCAKDVMISEGNVVKDLPLDQPVEVTLTFTTPGPVPFRCGMNMIHGTIVVQ